MAFKWRDTYSCNIAEIDRQHQKLFELGNNLFNIATLKDGYDHYDEIIKILEELKAYTLYHFSFEEKLMEDHQYERLDEHKIEHSFFVKKLQRIESGDLENNQDDSLVKLLEFVADWIAAHILKTDMVYKPFFNGKGVY